MPIKKTEKICSKCKRKCNLPSKLFLENYYSFKNSTDTASYYDICKICLIKNINNCYDFDNILCLFKELNIPFIENLWHESISIIYAILEQYNFKVDIAFPLSLDEEKISSEYGIILAIIEEYFKKAKLGKNTMYFFSKDFSNSIVYSNKERKAVKKYDFSVNTDLEEKEDALKVQDNSITLLDEYGNFRVELLSDRDYIYLSKKWGSSYNNYELVKLEEYWIKAFSSFDIVTSTHQDYLTKIAKISLQMDQSMEKKDWATFDTLAKLFDKMMQSANFAPKSKTAISERNFVTSVGELIKHIETKRGFIPKTDVTSSRDIVDAIIDNLNSYTKKLVMNEIDLSAIAQQSLDKMAEDMEKKDDYEEDEEVDDIDEFYVEENREDELLSSRNLAALQAILSKKQEEEFD